MIRGHCGVLARAEYFENYTSAILSNFLAGWSVKVTSSKILGHRVTVYQMVLYSDELRC